MPFCSYDYLEPKSEDFISGFESGEEQGYDIGYDTGYDDGLFDGMTVLRKSIVSKLKEMKTGVEAYRDELDDVMDMVLHGVANKED